MWLFLIPLHNSQERETRSHTHIHTLLHSSVKNQKMEQLISCFDMQACKESHNQIRPGPQAISLSIDRKLGFLGSYYECMKVDIKPHNSTAFPRDLGNNMYLWSTASYLGQCFSQHM